MTHDLAIHGPFYDDLALGDVFDQAPSVTLTDGLAAAHHAILGGRHRLALDRGLAQRVAGAPLASPVFAWDVSIGQSTLVTQRAIANLFYRGLRFRRLPAIGDTLSTHTEIVGLRPAEAKPGRPPRGLVAMRIRTVDQQGRTVLDYHRCALLPARAEVSGPARGDMLPGAEAVSAAELAAPVAGWNLAAWREAVPGRHHGGLTVGERLQMGGDLVSSAPELARMTLNLAAIHHDAAAGGGTRLVYGGHTVGLTAAQASRALPSMLTILGWHSCDHVGPVREGDTLRATLEIERLEPLPDTGGIAHIAATVTADRPDGPAKVLDWRFAAAFA